jgi:hypothetical protein
MKKLILLTLLLSATAAYALDFDGLPADVRPTLTALAKYPKAASILLWCKESYMLQSDGSQNYEWHSFRYIPDEAARDNWGDPHVAYVEGRQKLEILATRTYTRDGRKIDCTPQNAFNPMVPEGLDKAPDYTDFRQMVITLLGLENGCISELHYRLTTAKPLVPWLEGRVYFREEDPTISRDLEVSVPSGTTLTYKADRDAPEPTKNGNTYSWHVGEQAGYLKEDLGAHRVLLPNVAFTTAANWEEVQNYVRKPYEGVQEDLAVPASLQTGVNAALRDESKLDSIKEWVRLRFNLLAFEHPEFLLRLRPLSRVLQSGYGNDWELAALVTKLAQQAGLNAELQLRMAPEPPVPSLHEWASPVILFTANKGADYFECDPLKPRTEFNMVQLKDSWLLPLAAKKSGKGNERSSFFGGDKAGCRLAVDFMLTELDRDTVRGYGTLKAAGPLGIYETVHVSGAKDYLSGLLHIKGMEVTSASVVDLSQHYTTATVNLDFTFTAAHLLDTAGTYRVLPLFFLDYTSFITDAPLGLPKREFAQELPFLGELSLTVNATLPKDWKIERKPASGNQMWDWSEGSVKCDVKDNRLHFTRSLKLVREWLAPQGWNGFRTWLIESGTRPANAIVFKTK